jgi:Type II CAAX prenyl endopeptidase Rce1-like
MSVNNFDPKPAFAGTTFARRAWPIAAIGLVGIFSLLWQPIPPELTSKAPDLAALPPIAQRAVLIVNPLVLLIATTLVGAAIAHRVGLRSILAGTASTEKRGRALAASAIVGFVLGVLIAGLDAAITPHLGQAWQSLAANAPHGRTDLAIGLLYGGLTEEVIMRWGIMSLLAFAIGVTLGERFGVGAMASAIVLAAVIFAIAHLPALAAQIDLTLPIVTRTLLLNGSAGLLYGWLFYRHHLEAAMVAHAATHLGLSVWRMVAG